MLGALELLETYVDTLPSGADEIDQEREVVNASVPLGELLAFETLEPADRLVEKPADLCDVPGDWKNLRAKAVPNCVANLDWDRRLELRGCYGERLDLAARALERSFERRGLGPARSSVRDPLFGSFQCRAVHGRGGYSQRRMDMAQLDYELPEELIAQRPVEPRDVSRLLVYRRDSGSIDHAIFSDLPELVTDELVVINDSRVLPARLRLRRASGGAVEVLLLESVAGVGMWEVLARPSRRLRAGERLGQIELVESLGDGRWLAKLDGEPHGDPPLPPYVREPLSDPERYQTVYAREPGSAAAPTAGLHFTARTLARLQPARVTLHVGLDTFRPVECERLEEHVIHGERYEVAADAWTRIAGASRILAVGTTTVRVLETVARGGELSGRTTLFITPGFAFRRVDALLTNFHLPRSTLLALVMAFVGVDETRRIYRTAIDRRYRFYSLGDAMVVL